MAAPARVVIAGLDPLTESELSRALRELCVEVAPPETAVVDLAFCSPQALDDFRSSHPGLPVVVVSDVRQVGEWLDAIESGALDYCSAPFEPSLLGWILKSVSRPIVHRAA